MNHVSVSPTDGNGPTQGQRKTLTRVGIEPTTFGLDLTLFDIKTDYTSYPIVNLDAVTIVHFVKQSFFFH